MKWWAVNLFRGQKIKGQGHRVTKCKNIALFAMYEYVRVGTILKQPHSTAMPFQQEGKQFYCAYIICSDIHWFVVPHLAFYCLLCQRLLMSAIILNGYECIMYKHVVLTHTHTHSQMEEANNDRKRNTVCRAIREMFSSYVKGLWVRLFTTKADNNTNGKKTDRQTDRFDNKLKYDRI